MATLGNAVCGFAAIYIASLEGGRDPWTQFFAAHRFVVAAYLIFIAMIFDAVDGRLARFTRHTTDFGGQLDSMADVISFGVAPAILMLHIARQLSGANYFPALPFSVTRAIWAAGAVYVSCAAVRLARFNVSNQHGEQHHFSFLGLPSPGAGGTVAAMVLMCIAVGTEAGEHIVAAPAGGMMFDTIGNLLWNIHIGILCAIPVVTLVVGLLMVSTIRYPHLVNRYLKGKKSVGRLVAIMILCGATLAFHQYAIGIAMIAYTLWGLIGWAMSRSRRFSAPAA